MFISVEWKNISNIKEAVVQVVYKWFDTTNGYINYCFRLIEKMRNDLNVINSKDNRHLCYMLSLFSIN